MAITDYNREPFAFTRQPEKDAPYVKMADLYKANPEAVYTLAGMYINTRSRYGDNPVLYTDKFYVNAPQHLLHTVEKIVKDSDTVDQINAGRAGFKIYSYEANGKTCYSVKFVEIEMPF